MSFENVFVLSNGEKIPVVIENRRGAHNVTLRPKIEPKREIHISKPWMTSNSFVLKFVESKRKWIEKIFDNAPTKEKIKLSLIIGIELLAILLTVKRGPLLYVLLSMLLVYYFNSKRGKKLTNIVSLTPWIK